MSTTVRKTGGDTLAIGKVAGADAQRGPASPGMAGQPVPDESVNGNGMF